MAIWRRLNRAQIETEFTHVGWFCGICPVYIDRPFDGAPLLVERNWVPEWWFDFTEALFGWFCWLATFADPHFVPTFPIMVTGEIRRG